MSSNRNSGRSNFVDDVLAGHALATEIDEYISRWHAAADDAPSAQMELHDFLGMTWDEYGLWGEHPESFSGFYLPAGDTKIPTTGALRCGVSFL